MPKLNRCAKKLLKKQLLISLVQPHIDYCSQLYAPSQGTQMDKIENVLRKFLQWKKLPFWQRLKKVLMNSEIRRLERYKIIYTWTKLEERVPNCGLEENMIRMEQRGRMVKNTKTEQQGSPSRANAQRRKFSSIRTVIFSIRYPEKYVTWKDAALMSFKRTWTSS